MSGESSGGSAPIMPGEAIGLFRRYTGGVKSPSVPWPFSRIGGPLTHAAVLSALGAGGGWAYGRYVYPAVNPETDPETSARRGAVVGGSVMALSRAPELAHLLGRYGILGLNKSAMPFTPRPGSGVIGPRLPGPGPFDHGFSAGHAREDASSDRYLAPSERSTLMGAIPARGMITGPDVARGLMGAGVGYLGAGALGATLGTLFGMSRTTQKKLRTAGAIAGALRNTGIFGGL